MGVMEWVASSASSQTRVMAGDQISSLVRRGKVSTTFERRSSHHQQRWERRAKKNIRAKRITRGGYCGIHACMNNIPSSAAHRAAQNRQQQGRAHQLRLLFRIAPS